MIHQTADVQSSNIGKGTNIWQNTIVLPGALIGENCNINAFCFIENDVKIGNNVTVKCGIYIWDGVLIEDDVHLGPNVVFTNDIRHRSKHKFEISRIIIRKGASIGANSTILGGVEIGEYAMTGIGSVITRDIPAFALVYGNPAKQHGWVDETGEKLKKLADNIWESTQGKIYEVVSGKITTAFRVEND